MTELKIYSGKDESDEAKTQELKQYSQEPQSGPSGDRDREQETMIRASAEIERRTKKTMLYSNVDYFTASNRVVQADKELAMLWTHGYVKE